MKTIGMKKAKLLSAFAVLAIAFAVFAAIPAVAEDSDAVAVEEDKFLTDIGNGAYVVSGEQIVTISTKVAANTNAIELSEDTTISGNGTLTIVYEAGASGQSLLSPEGHKLTIADGTKVILKMDTASASFDGLHTIGDMNAPMTGSIEISGTLEIEESKNVQGTAIAGKGAGEITLKNGDLILKSSNGIYNVKFTTTEGSNIKIDSPNKPSVNSIRGNFVGTTITVSGAGTTAKTGDIWFYADTELNKTSVDTDGIIGFYEEHDSSGNGVDMTDSTIDSAKIGIANTGAGIEAKVNGTGSICTNEVMNNLDTLLTGNVVINVSGVTLTSEKTLTVGSGVTFTGVVKFGENSAEIKSVKAGTKGMTFTQGSIAIAGDFTETSGTITITGSATLTGDVSLDGVKLIVSDGASLLIPSGKTLTAKASSTIEVNGVAGIVNNGTVDASAGTLTVSESSGLIAGANSKTTLSSSTTAGNVSAADGATVNKSDGDAATDVTTLGDSGSAATVAQIRAYVEAGVEKITVTDDVEFKENFILPEGFSISVKDEKTITVGEGYKFTNEGTIIGKIAVAGIFENNGTFGDNTYESEITVSEKVTSTGAAGDSTVRCYVINNGTMYLGEFTINDVTNPRITEFTNAGELYLKNDASAVFKVEPDALFENTGSIYGELANITGDGSFVNANGDVGCKVSTATITGTMSVEEISGKTSGSRTYGALQELVIPEGKTWTISKANEITINGKLTVYGTLVVEGTLIIAGAGDGSNDAILDVDGTVTVAKDATLQIGKIADSKNYKASATIDGTFNLDGKLDLVCTPIDGLYGNYVDGFAVVGSMTVSKTGAIFKDEGIMTVYGDLTINGSFDDAVIVNKGVITIDNSKAEAAGNGEVQIGMYANGAVLNIDSFKFVNSGTEVSPDWNYIQVTDKGAILKAGKSGDGNTAMKIKDENANYFVIDGTSLKVTGATLDSAAFAGKLVITESISSKTITIGGEKATQYTNKMDVSGSASTTVSYTKDVGASADDTVGVVGADMGMMGGVTSTSSDSKYKFVGGVEITGELTIGKYLRMTTAGVIDVSGTVSNLVKGSATIANGGEITVTGLITTLNGITGGVVNAAYYEITTGTGDNESTTKNYSAFASAVDAVTVEGNTADKIVEVMGKITIKENVTVPAGVAVIFDSSADTNTLTVGTTTEEGRAVTVTFAKTATMRSASEQVIVNGTLTFEDKTNDLTRDTVSDVTVEDEAENGERTYTNIFTAIQNSSAGQTITVTKATDYVKITQSLTIPDGVTLYVPADAVSIVLDDGVTLTIDGTLMTELDVLAETMFGTSAMDLDAVEGGADAKRSSAIVVNGYMLVSLDVAANGLKYDNSTAVAGDGYSSLIAGAPIYGAYYTYDTDWAAVSPVDKAIAAIDKISDKIVLNGPITLGDIAFTGTDDCDEIEVSNKQVNNVPAGGVAIDTVVTANSVTIVDATFDVIGTFNGSVVVGGATVTFVDVSGFTAGFNTDDEPIVIGSLSEGVGEVDAAVTLAAGSLVAPSTLSTTTPFTVASGATLVAEGATFKTLKVAGTVSVESNKVLNVNVTDAVLSVLEGGVLDVAAATDTTAQGTVNVITLDVGMDSKKETTTGAVATINGPVNVTSKAFVVSGSNVSTETQTVLDKMYSTQYNVDGALWMTVYVQSNAVDVDAVKKAPVENAWFGGWENAKGDKATGVAHVGADDWKVVDAIIKTDVYKVFVYANEGIANVYIDSNLMQKGTLYENGQSVQGYFLMVAAGEHKITYDLTNGWTGTAVFKVNGNSISGNSFATEGTPKDSGVSFDPIVYNVQISGLEKSGYVPDSPDAPAESGMGITDYLLIILVVLIVVMAIIVAMRLMRS